MHGISVLEHHADERMPALVIGGKSLLLLVHDMRFAFGTRHDTLDRFLRFRHVDLLLVAPCGKQRRLVPGRDRRRVGLPGGGQAHHGDDCSVTAERSTR